MPSFGDGAWSAKEGWSQDAFRRDALGAVERSGRRSSRRRDGQPE
jgi:hypothetical protein